MSEDPTAKAASIALDILGADHYADKGVEYLKSELAKAGYPDDLTENHELLVKVGASATAHLILAELRKFAGREPVDDGEAKDQKTIWDTF